MTTEQTATRPPGQWRPEQALRISFGEMDEKGIPRKGDHIRITKRRREMVKLSGRNRIVYDVVPELQEALVEYLKERGVAGAAKPQRVPVYLIFDRPESNLYGAYAKFGAGGRRICVCEDWREKTPGEYTAQKLPDAEALRDELGNLPRQYYVGEAVWQDYDQSGKTIAEAKPAVCDWHTCPYIADRTCKVQAILTVRLRGFIQGGCPIAAFRTSSLKSWQELHYWMNHFLHETDGTLAGLPFWLVRGERGTKTPDGQNVFVPYATLEADGTIEQMLDAVADDKRRRLLITKQVQQLSAGLTEYSKEAGFDDEFHPDAPATGEGKSVAVWEMELRDAAEKAGIAQSQIDAMIVECTRTDAWEEAIERIGSGAAEVATGATGEASTQGENEDIIDAEFEDEIEAAPEPDKPDKPRDILRPADESMPDGDTIIARMKDLTGTSDWTNEHIIEAMKAAQIESGNLPKPAALTEDNDLAWQVIRGLHNRAQERELTEPFPAIFEATEQMDFEEGDDNGS